MCERVCAQGCLVSGYDIGWMGMEGRSNTLDRMYRQHTHTHTHEINIPESESNMRFENELVERMFSRVASAFS